MFDRDFSDTLVNSGNTIHNILVNPFFKLFNVSQKDSTYGRALLPFSPFEQKVRSPPYLYSEHKLLFPFNGEKDSFIYYQAWSLPIAKIQRDVDILFIHGLNDYGGCFSENCIPILEAGFRVITLDLPGFGRSSGLHAYVTDWQDFVKATKLVVDHIKETNAKENRQRKLTILGNSLGGLIAMEYSIKYPHTFDILCLHSPLVYVAGQSRPSKFAELVAKVIVNSPLERLPLVAANRGKGSSDPENLEKFLLDPITYHGNLRVATGLTLLNATEYIQANLKEVRKPFLVQHGLCDRITLYNGTKELFAKAQTPEGQKTMILYDRCEHNIMKDPFASEKVKKDLIDWLIKMDELIPLGNY